MNTVNVYCVHVNAVEPLDPPNKGHNNSLQKLLSRSQMFTFP